MRWFLRHLVLGLVWLCVLVVVLEASWRYYLYGVVIFPESEGGPAYIAHPTRSFATRPNAYGHLIQDDSISAFRNNSAGFRGPEIDQTKRRFRILVVGDSEVAGASVNQSDLFTILLEQQLGSERFEVVNGGVAAYNSVQTMLNARERSREIDPDLVIFGLTSVNDIQGTSRELRALYKRTFKRPVAFIGEGGRLEIDYSDAERYYEANKNNDPMAKTPFYRVYSAVYYTIKGAVKRYTRRGLRDPNVLLGRPFLAQFSPEYSTFGLKSDDYERLWSDGWAITKKIFLQSKRDAEAIGAKFVLMAIPGKIQLQKRIQQAYLSQFPNLKFDLTRVNRELESFAREKGIVHIDLLTPMLQARDAGEERLFHNIDQHLDKGGHVVMARAMAKQLKASGLLGR